MRQRHQDRRAGRRRRARPWSRPRPARPPDARQPAARRRRRRRRRARPARRRRHRRRAPASRSSGRHCWATTRRCAAAPAGRRRRRGRHRRRSARRASRPAPAAAARLGPRIIGAGQRGERRAHRVADHLGPGAGRHAGGGGVGEREQVGARRQQPVGAAEHGVLLVQHRHRPVPPAWSARRSAAARWDSRRSRPRRRHAGRAAGRAPAACRRPAPPRPWPRAARRGRRGPSP